MQFAGRGGTITGAISELTPTQHVVSLSLHVLTFSVSPDWVIQHLDLALDFLPFHIFLFHPHAFFFLSKFSCKSHELFKRFQKVIKLHGLGFSLSFCFSKIDSAHSRCSLNIHLWRLTVYHPRLQLKSHLPHHPSFLHLPPAFYFLLPQRWMVFIMNTVFPLDTNNNNRLGRCVKICLQILKKTVVTFSRKDFCKPNGEQIFVLSLILLSPPFVPIHLATCVHYLVWQEEGKK